MRLRGTSRINERGHLEIGGCDVTELARVYGTPLYIYDEALIRQKCREFVDAFRSVGVPFQVAYASKAFCTMAMCRIVAEEGLSLDVVSEGELYTALRAGFPPERIHFHGNNKSPDEIDMAVGARVGCFVVDNFYEMEVLRDVARRRGVKVRVLLRVAPGVEAHTHEYVMTGQADTKFGFDLESGAADRALEEAVRMETMEVVGVHAHIGSQIFETVGFRATAEKLGQLAARARERTGVTFSVVNVGGGFGIRYTEEDRPPAVTDYVRAVTDAVRAAFGRIENYPLPEVWVEPGRSVVGEAGTALYTIGSWKEIPGIRRYVAVDGGMADNPRPALYGARYEAILANRANEQADTVVTVAGKCCESGDMLIRDCRLPNPRPGDLLAVFCSGAYQYSMASNYNRLRRPAVVFVRDGAADVVVKRETLDDVVGNDVLPERLKGRDPA